MSVTLRHFTSLFPPCSHWLSAPQRQVGIDESLHVAFDGFSGLPSVAQLTLSSLPHHNPFAAPLITKTNAKGPFTHLTLGLTSKAREAVLQTSCHSNEN